MISNHAASVCKTLKEEMGMIQELLTQSEAAPVPARETAPQPPTQETITTRGGLAGFWSWLSRSIPTLLVLLALGGLAYWGHHTGWKLPKFSDLNGTAQVEADDWCKEHSVPESQCVECKAELLPKKDYGWCKTHGVHNCPLDHPDVAQLKDQPKITPADLERARRALTLMERPENNSKCPLYRRRVQFASEDAIAKAGVDVDVVQERPMVEAIAANGEITYDQTRVARLSSRVPGTVWRVEKEVGQEVKQGEVLALVDAAEVGRAKGEFLQALALVDQKTKAWEIVENLIKSETYRRGSSQELEAKAALREAQIRLVSAEQALLNLGLPIRAESLKGLAVEQIARRIQFLGLPESIAKTLDPQTTTGNLLPLKAPLDGIVLSREVVAGEVVDVTKTLFVVADLSQMWLTLNVRQEDARYLVLGQPVRFQVSGITPETTGKITWISTAIDEKTRTVQVRADLPNPDGRLRASTFGTGRIVLREESNAVVIPNQALHWDGSCHVVFVRDQGFFNKDAPKVFHTRTVRPGARDEQYTEIIAGVLSGEVIASKGSGVLRAELLKNNLGAG